MTNDRRIFRRRRIRTRPVPRPAPEPIQTYDGPHAGHDPRVTVFLSATELERGLHASGFFLDVYSGVFKQR